jgi:DNA-binding NtrC family response regulator
VKTGKVLVVSEDDGDLVSYCATLTALGYNVEMCSSYEGAARRIEGGKFDLVVLSQGTPAFEGRRVLLRNVELRRGLPIIVVARCLDVHCYLEAMELGALDYLERPAPKDIGWVLESRLRPRALAA